MKIHLKKKPHFGLKRVTSRDPYESIDLIEYYKSYNRDNELGRSRQALADKTFDPLPIVLRANEVHN
jgi:hypothetical protein